MKKNYDYKRIIDKVYRAYEDYMDEYPKPIPEEDYNELDMALAMFRKVKEYERLDSFNKVDYKMEESMAKYDLYVIFGIDQEKILKMTKNNLYMLHQSLWVNTLYEMIKKGEL